MHGILLKCLEQDLTTSATSNCLLCAQFELMLTPAWHFVEMPLIVSKYNSLISSSCVENIIYEDPDLYL